MELRFCPGAFVAAKGAGVARHCGIDNGTVTRPARHCGIDNDTVEAPARHCDNNIDAPSQYKLDT